MERILDIQATVLEHGRRGVTQQWVYQNIVQPKYRISRTTFYAYLGVNAKAEVKQIEAARRMQPELFDNVR